MVRCKDRLVPMISIKPGGDKQSQMQRQIIFPFRVQPWAAVVLLALKLLQAASMTHLCHQQRRFLFHDDSVETVLIKRTLKHPNGRIGTTRPKKQMNHNTR